MVIVEIHHPFHYPPTMVDHHPKGACQMVVCEVHARETGVGNWNILHQVQSLFLMWLARQTLKKNSNMQKLITFRVGDSVYALVAEGIKRKKWCHNSPKNILQESIIESIIVTLYSWRKKKTDCMPHVWFLGQDFVTNLKVYLKIIEIICIQKIW